MRTIKWKAEWNKSWNGSHGRYLRPSVWSTREKSPPWSWGIPCAGWLGWCVSPRHPAPPPYPACRQVHGELMTATASDSAGLQRIHLKPRWGCHSTNIGLVCSQIEFIIVEQTSICIAHHHNHAPKCAQEWHVLEGSHSFTCHPHVIHKWNEPSCIYSVSIHQMAGAIQAR